ncbi:MAG TPA: hypothetical protein VK886_13175 [Vicinamibacterales bacterium]|nr:hypothetical protein [Vicinamibacterales bacterium]
MRTGILVVAVASACAIAASWLMWWATKRSAVWSMAAAAAFAFAAFACAILIAWFLTEAACGN